MFRRAGFLLGWRNTVAPAAVIFYRKSRLATNWLSLD